jgi:hypothetical protein
MTQICVTGPQCVKGLCMQGRSLGGASGALAPGRWLRGGGGASTVRIAPVVPWGKLGPGHRPRRTKIGLAEWTKIRFLIVYDCVRREISAMRPGCQPRSRRRPVMECSGALSEMCCWWQEILRDPSVIPRPVNCLQEWVKERVYCDRKLTLFSAPKINP